MAPTATRSEKEILEAKLLLAESNATKKGKKRSKASSAEGKENQDTNKAKPKTEKPKRRPPVVVWADEKNHDLSWSLLNIIEESEVYLVAFNFDKGQGSNNSGGGVNAKLHSQAIARKLFLDPLKPDSRFSQFTEDDVEHLGTAIKNRIALLREKYNMHKNELKNTGHGLLEEDKEDEAEEGSDLALLIKAVLKKFPWYKKMAKLMRGSPITDNSALANSKTPAKNLDILKRKRSRSAMDDENDSDRLELSSNDSSDENDDEKLPATPSQSTKPVSRVGTGHKRKAIQDLVTDVSTASRDAQIKIARIKYEQKSQGHAEREKIKRQSAFEMERLRLEHQRREGEAQRAHELAMLERQLELERLRHAPPPSSAGPTAPGTWQFGIDPSLR
ncbi:hypothetical protein H0H93_003021 [Arthromyces matolae]|nr:hypothetical protein H0H93_003021 [Arthromyces matolae]